MTDTTFGLPIQDGFTSIASDVVTPVLDPSQCSECGTGSASEDAAVASSSTTVTEIGSVGKGIAIKGGLFHAPLPAGGFGSAGGGSGTVVQPTFTGYAIKSDSAVRINGTSNLAANSNTTDDDLLIYGKNEITIKGNITLPTVGGVLRDRAFSLGSANAIFDVKDGTSTIVTDQNVIIPTFSQLEQQELAAWKGSWTQEVSVVNTQTTDNKYSWPWPALNSTFNSGTAANPAVIKFTGGDGFGLLIPCHQNISNAVIIVENGDITLEYHHDLQNVLLIAKNGNININRAITTGRFAAIASKNVTVDGETELGGKSLIANGQGNITFNGTTKDLTANNELTLISQGDITFNGSRDTRATLMAGGTFTQNGRSTLFGSICAEGDITFNGGLKVGGYADIQYRQEGAPPPTLTAIALANDSCDPTDKITNDASISGRVIPGNSNLRIADIRVVLDNGSDANSKSVISINSDNSYTAIGGSTIDASGNYIISNQALKTLFGSSLTDGNHTIKVIVRDTEGNIASKVSPLFTLDTTPPSPNPIITFVSGDTGVIGDKKTTSETVSIQATGAAANSQLILAAYGYGYGDTTIATATTDAAGKVTFNNVSLAAGYNNFIVKDAVADIACNVGSGLIDITRSMTGVNSTNSSIPENSANNTLVTSLSVLNRDTSLTYSYSLVNDAGGRFQLGTGSNASKVYVKNSTLLDYENQPVDGHPITVRVTDSTGSSRDFVVPIMLTDVNEKPTAMTLSNNTIAENNAVNAVVGNVTSIYSDPDRNNTPGETHTYALVTGTGSTDNARFTLNATTGQLSIKESANFEAKSSYSILVKVTDKGGLTHTQALTIGVTDVNEAPTAITLSKTTIAENSEIGTTVATLTSIPSDPDVNNTPGETHTYALVTGTGDTDNSAFTISGNQLKLATSADFETKSNYNIRLQVTDKGGLTFSKTATINVTDVNEAPTAMTLSNNIIAENNAANAIVGNITSKYSDPDRNNTPGETHTYALVSGTGSTDNAKFTLNSTTGQLIIKESANFENKSSYSIRVKVTDKGGLTKEEAMTINVTDVNEAPTNVFLNGGVSISIPEEQPIGTKVGTLTSIFSDPDRNNTPGEAHTYSFVSGSGSTDNAKFTIVGDELRIASILDRETKTTYSVRVRATDKGGLSFDKALTIATTNITTPTIGLSNNVLPENTPNDTFVGNLHTAERTPANMSYSLVTGTGSEDNSAFTIVGNTLQLKAGADFETKNAYNLRIKSTNSANLSEIIEKAFTVNITDVNEAPTAITLSNNAIAENNATGATVGNLTSIFSDPDRNNTPAETHAYALVTGTGDTDNAKFSIVDGVLKLNEVADFEAKPSYSVRVQVTDKGGLTYSQAVTVNVTDVNEAPTAMTLSNKTIAENNASGATIGTLTSIYSDPDRNNTPAETHTYTLVNGVGSTDNAKFSIVDGVLKLNEVADFEAKPSYSIRVKVTDKGGLMYEEAMTIDVTDVNEAPTAMTLSNKTIAENNASGATIGTLTSIYSDPDRNNTPAETHTYNLVDGVGSADNAKFSIVDGVLKLNESADFEAKPSYSIRVKVTDKGGLMYEEAMTINITDVAESTPTDLVLSNNVLPENTANNTAVGMLNTIDADSSKTFTYSLVAGVGSEDNAAFSIVNNTLQLKTGADFEAKKIYNLRIQSTDSTGSIIEKAFVVDITDVNEAPTALTLSNKTIAENNVAGATIGTLTSIYSDPDRNNTPAETHTYSLVDGVGSADNAKFSIVDGVLKLNESADFETKSSYSIRVKVTDKGGLTYEEALLINISDLPENSSTDLILSNNVLPENTANNTAVGMLNTIDTDSSKTFTYSLIAGVGSDDNAAFSIVNNTLQLKTGADFETKKIYNLRIQSTDSTGFSIEKAFVVDITDVNEAPTALILSNKTIAENNAIGATIGSFDSLFSDPDRNNTPSESHRYDLVDGIGSTDNAKFAIVNGALTILESADFETQSSYSIRVKVTDKGGLTHEEAMTINISDVDEGVTPPAGVSLSNPYIAENSVEGTVVGKLSAIDSTLGGNKTFELVDNSEGRFKIVGDEVQVLNANGLLLDYETNVEHMIRVKVTNSANPDSSYEEDVVIGVTNVNEKPFFINLSNLSGTSSEPITYTINTGDVDAGDTRTISIISGSLPTGLTFVDNGNGSATISGTTALNIRNMPLILKVVDLGGEYQEQGILVTFDGIDA